MLDVFVASVGAMGALGQFTKGMVWDMASEKNTSSAHEPICDVVRHMPTIGLQRVSVTQWTWLYG
jgi:hypothetical protein